MRVLSSLVLSAALLTGSCSADDSDGFGDSGGSAAEPTTSEGTTGDAVLTVSEALARSEPVEEAEVGGFLIETGGQLFLAEMLAESFPPQPGGAVLEVTGVEIADVEGVQTTADTSWTETPVVVQGQLSGEVLMADAVVGGT